MLRFLVLLCFCASLHGKIYDCFMFFNEIELLKIRLAELYDVVDYFVLVESAETQRGTEKPFIFAENRELFAPYLSKIIYIGVNERHPEMGLWERENYQRNCIARGLKGCHKNDIILISDLDEIPRHTIIPEIVNFLSKRGHVAVQLQQEIYFYQLNRQTVTHETWGGGWWHGTIGTTYMHVARRGPQYFRNRRGYWPSIDHGGWHFTWMGGKEKIRAKMESVVEGRDDASKVTDEELQKSIDKHPIVPIDNTFPTYVIKNLEYLKSIGFIAE